MICWCWCRADCLSDTWTISTLFLSISLFLSLFLLHIHFHLSFSIFQLYPLGSSLSVTSASMIIRPVSTIHLNETNFVRKMVEMSFAHDKLEFDVILKQCRVLSFILVVHCLLIKINFNGNDDDGRRCFNEKVVICKWVRMDFIG